MVHERLYQDSKEHEKVIQVLSKKFHTKSFTFRPDLSSSTTSKPKTKAKPYKNLSRLSQIKSRGLTNRQ